MSEMVNYHHQEEICNFPWKLFHLLTEMENLLSPPIHWNHDGDAFIICNKKELCEKIIPNYFKMKQFKSFTRQLNIYGFTRPDEGAEFNTYSHPNFRKGRKELLSEIKRVPIKNPSPTPEPDDSPTTTSTPLNLPYYSIPTVPFPPLPPHATTSFHYLPWFPFDSNFGSCAPRYSYVPTTSKFTLIPRQELFPHAAAAAAAASPYHYPQKMQSFGYSHHPHANGNNFLLHHHPFIFSPEEVTFLQEVFTPEEKLSNIPHSSY